jgi:hypothetical protein
MYVMVDVEADGPIPGKYSMIELGAVAVELGLERIFHGRLRPISDVYVPEALAITGYTREQTLAFDDPLHVMTDFERWIHQVSARKPIFTQITTGLIGCSYVGIFIHSWKETPSVTHHKI